MTPSLAATSTVGRLSPCRGSSGVDTLWLKIVKMAIRVAAKSGACLTSSSCFIFVHPACQDVIADLLDGVFDVHDDNESSGWVNGRCDDEPVQMLLVGGAVHVHELPIGNGCVNVAVIGMEAV